MTDTTTHQQTESTAVPFDTLRWSQALQDGGVPLEQANAHAKVFAEAIGQRAASKEDLKLTEMELTGTIQKAKTEQLFWMVAQTGLLYTLLKLV